MINPVRRHPFRTTLDDLFPPQWAFSSESRYGLQKRQTIHVQEELGPRHEWSWTTLCYGSSCMNMEQISSAFEHGVKWDCSRSEFMRRTCLVVHASGCTECSVRLVDSPQSLSGIVLRKRSCRHAIAGDSIAAKIRSCVFIIQANTPIKTLNLLITEETSNIDGVLRANRSLPLDPFPMNGLSWPSAILTSQRLARCWLRNHGTRVYKEQASCPTTSMALDPSSGHSHKTRMWAGPENSDASESVHRRPAPWEIIWRVVLHGSVPC